MNRPTKGQHDPAGHGRWPRRSNAIGAGRYDSSAGRYPRSSPKERTAGRKGAGLRLAHRAAIPNAPAPRGAAVLRAGRRGVGIFGFGLLVVLTALVVYHTFALEQRIVQGESRISDIAQGLLEHRQDAPTRVELGRVRATLEDELETALRRVGLLEARSDAASRIIASASRSIMFLQVAYRFEESESGRPLRYVLGSDGQPMMTPGGPLMSLEGSGPVVERQFTGTAFVATADRLLVTNRHLARPWEGDEVADLFASQGLVPVMHRMVGFLPGIAEPIEVAVLGISDEADLALLRSHRLPPEVPPLELSPVVPSPGEAVIVMGYPTGIRALMARTESRFLEGLKQVENVDFWRVAQELSNQQHINPLASLGIVGQVSDAVVVYDAATAQGGSGGPVLGLDGRVHAVNSAIIAGFNGSNMGVPVARVLRILAEANQKT